MLSTGEAPRNLEAQLPGAAAPALIDTIRREQVATLFRNITVGVLGAFAGATLLGAVLVYTGSAAPRLAALWIGAGSACVAAHLVLRYLYGRAPATHRNWRHWAFWFTAIVFAEGVWWGYATLFLAGPKDFDGQILTLLTATAVAAGAALALSAYLPAFCAIFFPAMVPYAARCFVQGGATQYAVALMDVVFVVSIALLGFKANASFLTMLRLDFEKDALAEKLRREKERAEEANLSKSRFLASASHDLRQPVHALGMFLGALSSHPMNAEMRRLVEHMEGSVQAMDSLFSSLLDISRIDAGVIEPRPETFELQPMLQRICDEHAAEAQAKNNRLTLRARKETVYADPVLLERILRNVVSNAVRYTDGGRILVGCRAGERLRVEIHDTGCGIPVDEQERIFDEFYQIKNPERDRAKGLGLGLAIVKRLALVLDCPIKLKSQPGKGTVFTIIVPRADPALAPLGRAKEAPAEPSGRGLILVVDDEIAVREGMRSLLSSWGHDVLVAATCAEMIARISNCSTGADLIICDYRLRDGESGIDVIGRLQSEYNEEIPAILLTGDTAPDRVAEAKASGFHLLYNTRGLYD